MKFILRNFFFPLNSLSFDLHVFTSYALSVFSTLILILLSSCAWHPCTPEYHAQYRHLKNPPRAEWLEPCPYFLIVLVCARHLDYTNGRQLLKTIARHPSDGSKNSDVGHAWIFLQGKEGKIEGGHTGEFGFVQPRYFEGVADLIENDDPNPIRYLWATQRDGRFQTGAGGFVPTFAARIELSSEQYAKARTFIEKYPFRDYAITKRQCATFAADVAKIAGLDLEHAVTISIEPIVELGGENILLWTDARFSKLTISSPDILEKSLMQAVREGKAQNATHWYIKRYPKKTTFSEQIQAIKNINSQFTRSLYFN